MWIPIDPAIDLAFYYILILVIVVCAVLVVIFYIYSHIARKAVSRELSNALSDEDKTRIFRELNEDAVNPPKCPKCSLPSLYLNENTNQYQLETPPGYQIKLLRNLSIFCLKCDLGMRR